jgi:hypothetical protein
MRWLVLLSGVAACSGALGADSRVTSRVSPAFAPSFLPTSSFGRPQAAWRRAPRVPRDGARRTSLLQLRAQANPSDKKQEESGGIQWDVVQTQFALFWKMSVPYFKEEKSARMLLAIVIGIMCVCACIHINRLLCVPG